LLFGQLIIMVVYLPIFALTGVEGRCSTHGLHRGDRAAGAMILSITFIPRGCLFIGQRVAEKENR
jgi:Cu/Ag efflux pump CusA